VPVEFLSDGEAAAYGRFAAAPSRAELERWGLLDDADLRLANRRRVDHLRLGFALQLITARAVGTFLPDPLDVPTGVLDYVATQLEVADPSCVKRYTERRPTRFEHQAEIAAKDGYRDFSDAAAELERWVDDRAFTAGEGPKALFNGAVGWLRERQVLLPGVSTLARLVARVRRDPAALRQPGRTGHPPPSAGTGAGTGGARRGAGLAAGALAPSGRGMVTALNRVSEIAELGLGEADLEVVPARRVSELARYGLAAKAPAVRRLPHARRVATVLATVRWLGVKASTC